MSQDDMWDERPPKPKEKKMKYTLSATIPVMQYGNVQPTIEVEAGSFEEAQAIVAPQMAKLWEDYGVPLKSAPAGTSKRLKDFFGNEIDYDKVNHVYSWNGEIYESGSQYASKFDKPFNKEAIAGKMAGKYGVEAQDIIDMWELNGRTSMEFGTAMHSALELYGKHKDLAKSLERDSALHAHPVIRQAVESFYEGRDNETAHYEVLIVDHARKRAGQVDRLQMWEGDYIVQDFKTNAELKPDKLKVYWEQLKFYSGIIQANGGNTRPEQIFHYNGRWTTYNKGDK